MDDMDTSVNTTISVESVDTDVNTTISVEAEDLNYTLPTVIDVIDLTKESPLNRLSYSHHNCTENASTSRHITRSSRRLVRREALSPIVLGRRYDDSEDDYATIWRTRNYDITNNNAIVNFDNTNKVKDNKKKADKQDKKKDEKQEEADKCYTFQSDNRVPVSLTCPICLEMLSSNLKPTTTHCGHIFCAKCLKETIRKYKHCPTCKTAITLTSCIRLYL